MKETTKKIIMELVESELKAIHKSVIILDAAIKAAEAEKNASVVETQKRLKDHALQRIEALQDAIKDLERNK